MNRFADPLEPIGIAAGVLLVLVGIATLVGTPWAFKGGGIVAVGQILGAVSAVAIGAALAWLARADA